MNTNGHRAENTSGGRRSFGWVVDLPSSQSPSCCCGSPVVIPNRPKCGCGLWWMWLGLWLNAPKRGIWGLGPKKTKLTTTARPHNPRPFHHAAGSSSTHTHVAVFTKRPLSSASRETLPATPATTASGSEGPRTASLLLLLLRPRPPRRR